MSKDKAIAKKVQAPLPVTKAQADALAKITDAPNAAMSTVQTMLLAAEEILAKEFNFTEEQIKHLERELDRMFSTLVFLERHDLVVLSPRDMQAVGYIASLREKRFAEARTGLSLPEGVKSNMNPEKVDKFLDKISKEDK